MIFPVLAYFGMQTQRIGEAAAVSVATLPVLAILVIFATSLMQRGEEPLVVVSEQDPDCAFGGLRRHRGRISPGPGADVKELRENLLPVAIDRNVGGVRSVAGLLGPLRGSMAVRITGM